MVEDYVRCLLTAVCARLAVHVLYFHDHLNVSWAESTDLHSLPSSHANTLG